MIKSTSVTSSSIIAPPAFPIAKRTLVHCASPSKRNVYPENNRKVAHFSPSSAGCEISEIVRLNGRLGVGSLRTCVNEFAQRDVEIRLFSFLPLLLFVVLDSCCIGVTWGGCRFWSFDGLRTSCPPSNVKPLDFRRHCQSCKAAEGARLIAAASSSSNSAFRLSMTTKFGLEDEDCK